MNWYKQAQQSLLFYPYSGMPSSQSVKVDPISIDQETGENVYQCEKCKNPVLESNITVWYARGAEEPGVSYNMPTYNYDRILNTVTQVSQYLMPFYQQLQQYIKDQDLESKRNDTYDYGYRTSINSWEVQVPQLPDILKNSQEIMDICYFKNRGYSNSGLCSLLNVTEISGGTLEDLSDLILNPEKTAQEFFNNYSKKEFEVSYKVPVCDDCYGDIDKCAFCDKLIFPKDRQYPVVYNDTDVVCEDCLENGSAGICIECGKADSMDDMHYREDVGEICDECYQNLDGAAIGWAKAMISNLNIPIGKNLPLSEKVLKNLSTFLNRYIAKYGDDKIRGKGWGRLLHLSEKSGLPEGAIEYLINKSHDVDGGSISDVLGEIENNISAQEYMKEQYPNLKSYQDLPFDIEVLPNFSHEKSGFTIGITPSDRFFGYAERKYPNIRKTWDRMADTPHHPGVLAYARCSFEMGNDLVINNLQRDSDYDNYVSKSYSGSSSLEEAQWIDRITKDWDSFLLHLIKSICISENINAYLTTFDQQKQKWGNLPIHKSKKTYKEVPERMGFPLTDPGRAENMVERGGYGDMYQIANDIGMNWYKKAQQVNMELPIPSTLFHATYRANLESIQQVGITSCPEGGVKMYQDCQNGVYLHTDPDVAYSYVETADNDSIPNEWIEGGDIVVLSINVSYLDVELLETDPNLPPPMNEDSFLYNGTIPTGAITGVL